MRPARPGASCTALALGTLIAAVPATAQTPPDVVYITGVVRDFRRAHPDFDQLPIVGGAGHYAGTVEMLLPADGRPAFSGGGYKVQNEWTNGAGQPIAPHLFRDGATTIKVVNPSSPPGGGGSQFDSWDSYDDPTPGPAPTFEAGATMPQIVVPWSIQQLPNLGNLTYTGTNTFSQSFHCNALTMNGPNAVALIDGNVSILCEGSLFMATQAEIRLNPGARLTLYLMAGATEWNHVKINVPPTIGDPELVTVYNFSNQEIWIRNQADVCARIISPDAPLHLNETSEFYGTFVGLETNLQNNCDFHWSSATPANSCGVVLNDVEGAPGVASSGGITSAATFNQWYNDVLGVNLSTHHSIALVRNGAGIYEYDEPNFYPIDGLLFGNEGQAHNGNFTYEMDLEFVYDACTGQFFQFTGPDTSYVYVDGVLGIDLGGVEPPAGQIVEMDRLNLVDGQLYTLRFFYAHRYGAAAFNMRTNVEPIDVTTFLTSAPMD